MKNSVIYRTFTDHAFLKTAASVAVPVTLQLILSTVTNMLDTMMIGKLGTATISAVGLANKYFFVFALLIFGVHSGTGILMAQFFGNRDSLHIRKTFGLGLLINLSAALLFLLAAFFFPEVIFGIFTDSREATEIGTVYLKTVCFCYPLFACASILNGFLRSTRRVRIPVLSSSVSILVNLFLNYCLIFGHCGMPCLGVKGAAIATVIARLTELLILFWFAFIRGNILPGPLRDFFGWSRAFLKNFSSHALPVIFNEMIWGLGQTLYYVAYGHIGDSAVAAVTITGTVIDILTTAGNGLASAASVILGNELGAGHPEKADDYANKLLVLAVSCGAVIAVIFLLLRVPILSLYAVEEDVALSAYRCMTFYAFLLPAVFHNLVIIVGILRSGGDTRVCFIIDTGFVWFWAIPAAFAGALFFHLPIHIVYALVSSEEVLKTPFCHIRYRKKAWLKNLAKEV